MMMNTMMMNTMIGLFLCFAIQSSSGFATTGTITKPTTTTTTTTTTVFHRLNRPSFSPLRRRQHQQHQQTLQATASSTKNDKDDERMPLRKGSTCALITPFTDHGAIDVLGLQALCDFHLQEGTQNLCILGTTAEASVMSMDERAIVLRTVVDRVKGRLPIMVGTGTINPHSVKAMTLQAMDYGADANLLVSPYYVKPPQRCIVQHMTSMADLGLPLIVYQIPGRTGVDISDASLQLCAQHDNIVGIKDATGYLNRVSSLRPLVGDDFLMYSGDDATSLDYVLQGGDGCISVTANLVPNRMATIMALALAQKNDEAHALNEGLELLHNDLFIETNPIPTKWAAHALNLISSNHCRPPLDRMDPQYEPLITTALHAAGLQP